MLNSAADYRCVDVTGLSGFITGDPLPRRDKKGDGSWRAMKYEDLLFLQEAREERRLCAQSALPAKASPKGRVLSWSVFSDAFPTGSIDFRSQTESGGFFMDADVAIPTAVTTCSTNENPYAIAMPGAFSTTYNDYVPEYEPLSWKKPVGDLALGNVDDVRRAYYNVQEQTRSIIYAPSWYYGTITATLVIHHNDGTSETVDYSDAQVAYEFIHTNRGRTNYLHATWTPPANLGRFVFARSATLLICLICNGGNGDAYDLIPFHCTVTNGLVAMPQIDFATLISDACTRHGIPYYATDPGYIESNVSGSVWFSRMSLIIDHDFPAEVESLNWNWEPEGRQ